MLVYEGYASKPYALVFIVDKYISDEEAMDLRLQHVPCAILYSAYLC
jgi:hypothetical protein